MEETNVIKKDKYINVFKILNLPEFIKKLDGRITDKELIALISTYNRCNRNFEIVIAQDKEQFTILYKDSKFGLLREMPYSKLNKDDICYLSINKIIKGCKGKLGNKLIEIHNKSYYIMDFTEKLRDFSIRKSHNGIYIAYGFIRKKKSEEFCNWQMICSIGKTEEKAIEKLKKKLFDNLYTISFNTPTEQHTLEMEDLDI